MNAGYLVAALCNEFVQALDRGSLFTIRPDVENLCHCAVVPLLDLDLDAGHFLW